jgi:hypothetical protein
MRLWADLSLIRDYPREDKLVERPVGITQFQKGQKILFYVNADHVSGIDNRTCETVRVAVETCGAERVIIEGLETVHGISPQFYIDFVCREEKRGFPAGEHNYAGYLALRNNIPFIGGEPTRQELSSAMESEGFSPRDTMAFRLLQSIPQERREGFSMDRASFDKRAQCYLDHYADLNPAGHLTIKEVEDWYVMHRPDDRHFLDLSTQDFAPYNDTSASYFQRFNHRLGLVREQHLDTLIADSLNAMNRVLVVYGDGHLVQSRAVFENMLGPGQFIQVSSGQPSRPLHQRNINRLYEYPQSSPKPHQQ